MSSPPPRPRALARGLIVVGGVFARPSLRSVAARPCDRTVAGDARPGPPALPGHRRRRGGRRRHRLVDRLRLLRRRPAAARGTLDAVPHLRGRDAPHRDRHGPARPGGPLRHGRADPALPAGHPRDTHRRHGPQARRASGRHGRLRRGRARGRALHRRAAGRPHPFGPPLHPAGGARARDVAPGLSHALRRARVRDRPPLLGPPERDRRRSRGHVLHDERRPAPLPARPLPLLRARVPRPPAGGAPGRHELSLGRRRAALDDGGPRPLRRRAAPGPDPPQRLDRRHVHPPEDAQRRSTRATASAGTSTPTRAAAATSGTAAAASAGARPSSSSRTRAW